MAKERLGDSLDDLLGPKPATPPVSEAPSPTADPQSEMKGYMIRMPISVWKVLQRHFATKGLKAGTGIRQLVMEYAKEQGLL